MPPGWVHWPFNEPSFSDPAYAHLPAAVEAGLVDEAVLDTCVRRILTTKIKLGLLDQPFVERVLGPLTQRMVETGRRLTPDERLDRIRKRLDLGGWSLVDSNC